MRHLSRRHFLATTAALGTLPLIRCAPGAAATADAVFRHGVASGDPLTDRVILWTRVTTDGTDAVPVRWMVARDARLTDIVARGESRTGAARDFTVKVDVPGLEAGTHYFYRFEALGVPSAMGRTRTLPGAGAERLRLAVTSCSNLPFGYFNAYAAIARRPDLDAVLHLGDYIYEYPNAQYGDGTALGRVPAPDRETLSLEDYRTRHAQYKADPDSQEVHRQHPFICVWDDHELANDAWWGGAQNHNPEDGEGDWYVRRNAAVQAYYEWMPVREHGSVRHARLARTFSFGTLADVIMVDSRLVGRDQQAASREDIATLDAPHRSMLGRAQEGWLGGEFTESVRAGTGWQILGQQTPFAPQSRPGSPAVATDNWDGYRAARDRMFDLVEETGVTNFAVLTGDVHSVWAYDLPRRPFDDYDPGTGRGSLGVELACTSVTSPSSVGAGPDGEGQLAAILAARPHLRYVEGRRRGYYILDVTRERLQADHYFVRTIEQRSPDEAFAKGFVCESGSRRLVETASPARPAPAPDPAP
ncbi:MAG: alkaline phosphatase D family protein [Vicinamibacterales bacterium]|nr:alkaline phosphatase D family protein [Vicinamibacterales bacterium]